MIERCKNCNYAEFFDKNDEFGIRLKLKDHKCECGGKFQKMYATSEPNRWINSKGESYEYTAIGEFRKLNSEQNVQGSVATGDDSSNADDQQKIDDNIKNNQP